MIGHNTFAKHCGVGALALSTSLQPLTGYAQALGEAFRNADHPLPHVLPIADRVDLLPLPYVPDAWRIDVPKAAPSNAIALEKTVDKSTAVQGDAVTWTLLVHNTTGAAMTSGFKVTDTLPTAINNIVLIPGSGMTCTPASPAAGAVVTCTLPTIAVGTTNRVVATFTARPTGTGSVTNTANLKNAAGTTTYQCNGVVGNCTVTTQVQDDDDNLLPTIIAALKPKCTPLTASTSSVIAGDAITLTTHCTFKGNLQRRFGFYRTDSDGALSYIGDSIPAGTVTFVTAAPSLAGVYTYTMIALNGNIPANLIGGVSVTVANNVPPAVAITTPGNSAASTTYSLTTAYTVTATANDVDQGVSTIQLQWKASGAPSWSGLANCNFTPSVNASRLCSGSIPAGAVAGTYVVRAIATDARGVATTSTETAITTQPATLNCSLSVNPNPPTAGSAATFTAACQSGGQTVTGLNFTWLGAASACGSSSSTTCQVTPASTGAVSYGVSATKVNYATGGASLSVSANPPPLQALQCSLTVSPVKSSYSAGDAITLTPRCLAGGNVVSSNLVAQSWLINGGNSFDTYGCFANCPQTLTPSYLTNNLAGGAIAYAVSVSGNGYASTSANVAINASNISGALIANGSFESNAITNAAATQTFGSPGGQFAFGTEATNSDPGRVWVFNADSGVQRYGSLMSGTNQPPPGGASSQQTGLVRAQGTLSTTVALAAGQYSLSFQAANRSNYGGQQAVQVRVGDTTLPGSYTPTTGFASYSASFSVAAGNTEIAFVGVNAGDNTALIDNVVLSPVTSSLTPPSGCVITAPTSLVSSQSGSFSVTCSAGSAPLSYAWSRTLTGFSNTAQSFTDTPFSSATTTVASAIYSVNVSNAAGNQVAAPINVTNGSFTGPPPSTGSETLIFIHPNVSGSPIMATDANGAVLWREDYSAFGERTKNQSNANAGTGANQNWFIGKPQDTQTGLVYFGARWYDPVVGRFLGFDPAGVDEANPHSFNRYAYGNNNPNKFLDPDGRQVAQIAVAAGGLYLAGSMMAPQAGKGAGVMAGGTPPPQSSGVLANPALSPQAQVPGGFQAAVTSGMQVLMRLMHPEIDAMANIITRITETGSYTVGFDNGMSYHGKGSEDRMNQSAREKEAKFGVKAISFDHKAAPSGREALKDEARRIRGDEFGVNNKNNYNIRNSPGEKLLKQDGE